MPRKKRNQGVQKGVQKTKTTEKQRVMYVFFAPLILVA
jgi:hypothetical protein